MKLSHLIIHTLTVTLLGSPLVTYGQQSLDQLKADLERKKVEQQLAEAEKGRLEAEKAVLKTKQEIDNADKPAQKTPTELAEAQKAISEAEAATLKAKKELLATPFTVATPKGSVSATGTFPEAIILNQESLAVILAAMIQDIQISTSGNLTDKKSLKLLLYNANDFNGLASYASLLDQFNQLNKLYTEAVRQAKKLLNPPSTEAVIEGAAAETVSLALTGANSIVQTVGGIVQLFRKDVSFTNSDLTVDESNLTALMYSALRSQQMPWHVYHPAVYPVDVVKRIGGNISSLQNKLDELNKQSALAKVEIANVGEKIKALTTKTTPKAGSKGSKLMEEETKLLIDLTTAKSNLQVAEKAYVDVLTSLNTVDPTAKLTPLIMMTRVERLANILTADDTYVVKMTATATGSQKITQGTFIRTRLEHSAGAVLSYEVFSPTGEIICSAANYKYSPFKESTEIVHTSIPITVQPPAKIGTGQATSVNSSSTK